MSEYPNWFLQGGAQHNFAKHLVNLQGKPIKALQIGAYTGDATVWLFENVLTNPNSSLTDVDTWEGSDEPEHAALDWRSVEQVYDSKIDRYMSEKRLLKIKSTSDKFFDTNKTFYDFIYVDGDHTAASVLKDGINAIKFLAPGGILAFDDYMWRSGKGPTYDPYIAIDTIVTAYIEKFDVIELGLQVWLRSKN